MSSATSQISLFGPYNLAGLTLANRIVMAPMTRARNKDYIANSLNAEYYVQRITAGLIVSEGTPISPEDQGYVDVPGIWSPAQVAGWKVVTSAVHQAGGHIFAQIWHVGRMSHSSLQPAKGAPVSASAKPVADSPTSQAFVYQADGSASFVPPTPPRALETDEIPRLIHDFEAAAANAIAAGFDGIEIHAANGYLLEQFLNPGVNTRTDAYGGSLENHVRLILDVVDAVATRIGAHKVGIRFSPFNHVFDMLPYPENAATYIYLAKALSQRGLAYIHLNDNYKDGQPSLSENFLQHFRTAYSGTIILAGHMTKERAEQLLTAGLIDLPAFGQPFISNPDLVERLQTDTPLATPDRATYYGGGEKGYLDYPAATAN